MVPEGVAFASTTPFASSGTCHPAAHGGCRMNMATFYQWLGWGLGLEQMQSVEDAKISFAASWAERAPMLLFFGLVGLVAAAAIFYFRHQTNRHSRWRVALFVIR